MFTDPTEWDASEAGVSERLPPIPDAVALVVEASDMVTVFAADRLERVERMRRELLRSTPRTARDVGDVIERGIRLELAAALRITEYAAAEMLALAEAVVQRYPVVLHSMRRAALTERHAQVLVDALDRCDPEVREALIDDALALSETLAVGEFRRRVRELVEAAQAPTIAQRHEQALTQRRVVLDPPVDGMSWLHALLPAVEAQAAFTRMTGMAKVLVAAESDDRSVDQARADVMCDLLIEADFSRLPDAARGIRASVVVTVPALALLDGADAAPAPRTAVVEGVGPIPIDRARELCGGAEGWMRVLTDPEHGMVLSVGRRQYRPPPGLRRLVRWRSERCMAPGCLVPASRCQIDHTLAWEHGGQTSAWNTAPLCHGHHIVKHHGGWSVRQVEDSGGALEWTSPSGRRYLVEPERRVPAFRPDKADLPGAWRRPAAGSRAARFIAAAPAEWSELPEHPPF